MPTTLASLLPADALAVGLLLSLPLGLLGAWVVLRGLAFFSHAIGAATFPGTVAGLALGGPTWPWLGGLVAAGGFAAAANGLERDGRAAEGAITGLLLAGAIALGAVLLELLAPAGAEVEEVLFGSLTAIPADQVLRCGLVALLAGGAVLWAGPRLAATSFDPEWAASAGARPGLPAAVLAGLLVLTVVSATPVLGSLLAPGLLVLPAASVRLLTRRVAPLLAGAVVLCATEIAGGLLLARALGAPPGAAIATLAGLLFALAALAGRTTR